MTSVGSRDIFIAKYDNNGNYFWAKSIGGTVLDESFIIALDGYGNLYITGYFNATSDFDPGVGVANLVPVGSRDILFAKYDNNGNYLWAKNIGSTLDDFGYSLAVDAVGNVYITGEFQGTADFDPGTGTANLTTNGSYDIYIAKYDNNGNYLWANKIGGTSSDAGNSITIDGSGNIYITGGFYGTTDFDPGAGTANLTSSGVSDIFFAKYGQLTGVDEFGTGKIASIFIYPNPTNDRITITNNKISKETIVGIYDLQGNKIMENKFQNQSLFELNVGLLSKGIYMVKIQNELSVETKKLMIQ